MKTVLLWYGLPIAERRARFFRPRDVTCFALHQRKLIASPSDDGELTDAGKARLRKWGLLGEDDKLTEDGLAMLGVP